MGNFHRVRILTLCLTRQLVPGIAEFEQPDCGPRVLAIGSLSPPNRTEAIIDKGSLSEFAR